MEKALLIWYLNNKKIPFHSLPFGVQIKREFHNHDDFKGMEVIFFDTTFLIPFKK